ncbi:MAG: hypothetical protein SFW67_28475 [Myxococcaceae bacterium]|nr:hypothetical protein [Myxococcaceae bacterium]
MTTETMTVPSDEPGVTLTCEVLARFSATVQGEPFGFAVLKVPGSKYLSVTALPSRKRLGWLDYLHPRTATTSELISEGRRLVKEKVSVHGEARVRAVLAGG